MRSVLLVGLALHDVAAQFNFTVKLPGKGDLAAEVHDPDDSADVAYRFIRNHDLYPGNVAALRDHFDAHMPRNESTRFDLYPELDQQSNEAKHQDGAALPCSDATISCISRQQKWANGSNWGALLPFLVSTAIGQDTEVKLAAGSLLAHIFRMAGYYDLAGAIYIRLLSDDTAKMKGYTKKQVESLVQSLSTVIVADVSAQRCLQSLKDDLWEETEEPLSILNQLSTWSAPVALAMAEAHMRTADYEKTLRAASLIKDAMRAPFSVKARAALLGARALMLGGVLPNATTLYSAAIHYGTLLPLDPIQEAVKPFRGTEKLPSERQQERIRQEAEDVRQLEIVEAEVRKVLEKKGNKKQQFLVQCEEVAGNLTDATQRAVRLGANSTASFLKSLACMCAGAAAHGRRDADEDLERALQHCGEAVELGKAAHPDTLLFALMQSYKTFEQDHAYMEMATAIETALKLPLPKKLRNKIEAKLTFATTKAAWWADQRPHRRVLDLEGRPSCHDLKKAYRKLARKWHPDKATAVGRKRATRKFIELGESYEVLGKKLGCVEVEEERPFDYEDIVESYTYYMENQEIEIRTADGTFTVAFDENMFQHFGL